MVIPVAPCRNSYASATRQGGVSRRLRCRASRPSAVAAPPPTKVSLHALLSLVADPRVLPADLSPAGGVAKSFAPPVGTDARPSVARTPGGSPRARHQFVEGHQPPDESRQREC